MAASCEIAFLVSGFILSLWFPLKQRAAAMLEVNVAKLLIVGLIVLM